jgi:hypothetical protein
VTPSGIETRNLPVTLLLSAIKVTTFTSHWPHLRLALKSVWPAVFLQSVLTCSKTEIQIVLNILIHIIPSYILSRGGRWFQTDVSGLPIGSVFKGQAAQWRLKLGPISGPELPPVSNHLTHLNNPRDGTTQFNRCASLRSCMLVHHTETTSSFCSGNVLFPTLEATVIGNSLSVARKPCSVVNY